jgi:hypothetical protein
MPSTLRIGGKDALFFFGERAATLEAKKAVPATMLHVR